MADTNSFIRIPRQVSHDDQLSLLARLLFGEIYTIAGKNGECHASDSYFVRTYHRHRTTIQNALEELKAAGYLRVEYREAGRNGRVLIPYSDFTTALS